MNPSEGLKIIKERFKTEIFTGSDTRPWGNYEILVENTTISAKFLNVTGILSLQSHEKRSELWYIMKGPVYVELGTEEEYTTGKLEKYLIQEGTWVGIPAGILHRLSVDPGKTGKILEILLDRYEESDIKRFEDKYGRI